MNGMETMAKLISSSALLLFLLTSGTDAFTARNTLLKSTTSQNPSVTQAWATLPTPEESAKALTDYMAKAHEEKIKQIKLVEAKKDAEIKSLKNQLDTLKASRGTSSIELTSSSETSGAKVEELSAKLALYQKFMAEYIVKASEAKAKAVKAAELALTAKYEAKLLLAAGAAPPKPPTETKTAPVVAKESAVKVNPAYAKRNANLAAAVTAGKNTRWGDSEVQKAANIKVTTSAPATPPANTAFAKRNANLAAAVTAGKNTRWGDSEVQKATNIKVTTSAPVATDVPQEVIDADHGMRADGGVSGLTLAERVMLGSQAPTGSGVTTTTTVAAPPKSLTSYDKRNAHLIKAAEAGLNSRWGELEVKAVLAYEEQRKLLGPSSSAAVKIINVEEADHGMRADGGVGGPTLSDRVNLGAALLAINVEEADHGMRADGGVGGPTLSDRVNLGAALLANQ